MQITNPIMNGNNVEMRLEFCLEGYIMTRNNEELETAYYETIGRGIIEGLKQFETTKEYLK